MGYAARRSEEGKTKNGHCKVLTTHTTGGRKQYALPTTTCNVSGIAGKRCRFQTGGPGHAELGKPSAPCLSILNP